MVPSRTVQHDGSEMMRLVIAGEGGTHKYSIRDNEWATESIPFGLGSRWKYDGALHFGCLELEETCLPELQVLPCFIEGEVQCSLVFPWPVFGEEEIRAKFNLHICNYLQDEVMQASSFREAGRASITFSGPPIIVESMIQCTGLKISSGLTRELAIGDEPGVSVVAWFGRWFQSTNDSVSRYLSELEDWASCRTDLDSVSLHLKVQIAKADLFLAGERVLMPALSSFSLNNMRVEIFFVSEQSQ